MDLGLDTSEFWEQTSLRDLHRLTERWTQERKHWDRRFGLLATLLTTGNDRPDPDDWFTGKPLRPRTLDEFFGQGKGPGQWDAFVSRVSKLPGARKRG